MPEQITTEPEAITELRRAREALRTWLRKGVKGSLVAERIEVLVTDHQAALKDVWDERIRALEEERNTILRIVADWARRSAEYGGLDSGDLAWDLEQAGHPLPTADADPTERSGQ